MNLVLTRKTFGLYGVMGEIHDESGAFVCYSLEHSYLDNMRWIAKVAVGTYTCVRHAPQRLLYETFELQNVPPFKTAAVTGILIHKGNFNGDSEGCILVGAEIGKLCILESKIAFDHLMELEKDVASFTLTIV